MGQVNIIRNNFFLVFSNYVVSLYFLPKYLSFLPFLTYTFVTQIKINIMLKLVFLKIINTTFSLKNCVEYVDRISSQFIRTPLAKIKK